MQVDQKSSKISGELGSLSKADGSSKFTINDTVQLCAVYGPGEVKIVKEMAERAYVNVVYKPRVGASTNREKVMEYTLKSILDGIILTHLHPRTAINIVFQEIQNDSNYLACALNSACLALLDAGVPLKYTFGAVCCSVIENADRVVFFPSLKQEKDAVVSATFLFDSCEKELLAVHTSGTFDREQFNNLLNNAKQYVIENIFPLYNSLIKEKYHKNLN